MKRILLLLFISSYFIDGGRMYVYGESLASGLDALKEMEIWVYCYTRKYDVLPQSLNDLIENTPSDPAQRIRNLYSLYLEKRAYIINFELVNKNRIKITIRDGNTIFVLENENNRNFFYINEQLVIEYSRDEFGRIFDYKEFFNRLVLPQIGVTYTDSTIDCLRGS
jgi:hypothetical protein